MIRAPRLLRSYLRPLFRAARAASRRHLTRRSPRDRRWDAPSETLETRTMLTAYVINSASDGAAETSIIADGNLTLREALIAARTNAAFVDAAAGEAGGPDRIFFSPEVFGDGLEQTITLEQGDLRIFDDVLIDGSDRGITIDAANASRHFRVASGGSLTIGNLELVRGRAGLGGSIAAFGELTVDSVTFDANAATGPFQVGGANGGGAIYSGGGLTVEDSTFTRNTATGSVGSGGAILIAGGGDVLNSDFEENTARRAGGAIEVINGDAVVLDGVGARFNDVGMTIPGAPGNGGFLHAGGGTGVFVLNSDIDQNTALREGGGLWTAGGLIVENTTLTGNVTTAGNMGDGGGGIYSEMGDVAISNSVLIGNDAIGTSGSGGAVLANGGTLRAESTLFEDNLSVRAGGAIEAVDAEVRLFSVQGFFNATGVEDRDGDGDFLPVDGGANPGNGGFLHASGASTIVVTRSVLNENVAAREGGALWTSSMGTAAVDQTVIERNRAFGDAADDGGGAIFNNGGRLTVLRSNIAGNTAEGASGSGGGILSLDGDVVIRASILENNEASRAGGAIEIVEGSLRILETTATGNSVGDAPGNGGVLHITGAGVDTEVRGSTFAGNLAALEGGALWNQAGSTMTVTDSQFHDNVASGDAADDGGGAIFNNGGRLVVQGGTFLRNVADGASGSGGAIFTTAPMGGGMGMDGMVAVEGSFFDGNTANRAGGAIELVTGSLRVDDSSFQRNSVAENANPGNGGAIHVSGGFGTLTRISGSSFTANRAVEGGALWNATDAQMAVMDTVISRNEADTVGGGIFNLGQMLVEDSEVIRNAASDGGGLFAAAGSTADLNNVIALGNTPNNTAGPGMII